METGHFQVSNSLGRPLGQPLYQVWMRLSINLIWGQWARTRQVGAYSDEHVVVNGLMWLEFFCPSKPGHLNNVSCLGVEVSEFVEKRFEAHSTSIFAMSSRGSKLVISDEHVVNAPSPVWRVFFAYPSLAI